MSVEEDRGEELKLRVIGGVVKGQGKRRERRGEGERGESKWNTERGENSEGATGGKVEKVRGGGGSRGEMEREKEGSRWVKI